MPKKNTDLLQRMFFFTFFKTFIELYYGKLQNKKARPNVCLFRLLEQVLN